MLRPGAHVLLPRSYSADPYSGGDCGMAVRLYVWQYDGAAWSGYYRAGIKGIWVSTDCRICCMDTGCRITLSALQNIRPV